jgi:hypothetical protein
MTHYTRRTWLTLVAAPFAAACTVILGRPRHSRRARFRFRVAWKDSSGRRQVGEWTEPFTCKTSPDSAVFRALSACDRSELVKIVRG